MRTVGALKKGPTQVQFSAHVIPVHTDNGSPLKKSKKRLCVLSISQFKVQSLLLTMVLRQTMGVLKSPEGGFHCTPIA